MGEDIAQELVDWFSMVDATYRHDLRELNELNFARFDAKLEQRIAEMGGRVAALEAKIDAGFVKMSEELEKRVAKMSEDMERRVAAVRTDIIKWMFVFWATNALIVFGLVSRFLQS